MINQDDVSLAANELKARMADPVNQNQLIWDLAIELAHEFINENDFDDWGLQIMAINDFAREAIKQAKLAKNIKLEAA